MDGYIIDKNNLLEVSKEFIYDKVPFYSVLANLSVLIKEAFKGTDWAGFYLYNQEDDNLYVGPFQGGVACVKIKNGHGVCGSALKERRSILVNDVHEIDNYIACSNSTNSEIVVPIIKKDGTPVGVIDLDSDIVSCYSKEDIILLEQLADLIALIF